MTTAATTIRNLTEARTYGTQRATDAPLATEAFNLQTQVKADAIALGATEKRAEAAAFEAFIVMRRRYAEAHTSGTWCPGNGCKCGAPQSDGTRVEADDATRATYRQIVGAPTEAEQLARAAHAADSARLVAALARPRPRPGPPVRALASA